jgi:hypothetical protein
VSATHEEGARFLSDGDRYVPTELARGPWSPGALHGGPVAALLAGAVESVPADEPVHVTRLTVELLRPVGMVPLTLSSTVVRPGRKVQVVEASLSDGGRDVAWVRALRIRLQHGERATALTEARESEAHVSGNGDAVDPTTGRRRFAPPGPDEGYATPSPIGPYRAFHNAGAELRYVSGSFGTPGPATVWVRLTVPVVGGREPSPLQRVAAAADFGNGVSAVLDFARYSFINPDLTVTLARPAVGQWVCLDAVTRTGIPGVAVASSTLFDLEGPIGQSVQSLLVEPRL